MGCGRTKEVAANPLPHAAPRATSTPPPAYDEVSDADFDSQQSDWPEEVEREFESVKQLPSAPAELDRDPTR